MNGESCPPVSSTPPGSGPRVLILGGGLAGLSTAVALVSHGWQVTLLESRPRLGGRATSVVDPVTGELIDNCQHVNMGCCVNFQRLCARIGASDLLTTEQELTFIATDGKRNRFRNSWLPAPAHLAGSFLKLSYLSLGEKLSLAGALWRLLRTPEAECLHFQDWMDQQRQSPRLQARFWNTVLVSALSESADRIAYAHARKVFLQGFLQHRDAWKVQLLNVSLGEFYNNRLAVWLKHAGVHVHCQTGVDRLITDTSGERLTGVELRDGRQLTADQYVLATSWDRAADLLPTSVLHTPDFAGLSQLESAPISSVHFWLDRPLTKLRHAVLIDRVGQWLFNRQAILQQDALRQPYQQPYQQPYLQAQQPAYSAAANAEAEAAEEAAAEASRRQRVPSPEQGYAYQVVISNSRRLKQETAAPNGEASQQAIIAHVWQELQEIWPEARLCRVLHARVITEHRAVFSVTPDVEALRPPQQTPLSNLQLAGDYTRTGWPATMEGAVRSGLLAARNLLRHNAQTAAADSLLAPELPTSPLWRLLCRNESAGLSLPETPFPNDAGHSAESPAMRPR